VGSSASRESRKRFACSEAGTESRSPLILPSPPRLVKAEVERYNNAAFRLRYGEDIHIGHPLQALVAKMRRVVSIFLEPNHDPPIHVHVAEEAHGNLRGDYLLLSQPSRVFDGLLDIFALKIRVSFQDLVEAGAMRNLAHDDGDGDPHAADASAPAHDLRVESDSVEHFYRLYHRIAIFAFGYAETSVTPSRATRERRMAPR